MRSSKISRPWGLKELKQQFLKGDNKTLLVAWAFVVAFLTMINSLSSSQRLSFFGIADSYELSINFEYPVKIKRIHVISGQFVEKGVLLAELNQNEIDAHIRELETTIQKLQFEKNIRSDIRNLLDDEQETAPKGSLALEIESAQKELSFAKNQKNNLLIFAEKSGIVGAVNFKSGQTVPPFTTLLTILSQKPDMIKAYIHEKVYSQVEIDQEVLLSSIADKRKNFSGRVVSIGSRIVEMPERLTNSPVLKVWGREVMVQLSESNTFLMGEKVVIYPKSSWFQDNLLPIPTPAMSAKHTQTNEELSE